MPSRLEGVLLMTLYLIIAIAAWYVAVSCNRGIALLSAAQVLSSSSWVIDMHIYGYLGSTPANHLHFKENGLVSEVHEYIRAVHT